MRTAEEVEAATAVLTESKEQVRIQHENKELSDPEAEYITKVIDSTLQMLDWFRGADVEITAGTPLLMKAAEIATGVNLFSPVE